MRTTDADVKDIIATELDTTPFILTASLLVDTYFSTAGYSALLLRELEKWWAAHLVAIREPRVQEKVIDDTRVRYAQGTLGKGLESTPYGQMVLTLDSMGILATEAESGGVKYARLWVD